MVEQEQNTQILKSAHNAFESLYTREKNRATLPTDEKMLVALSLDHDAKIVIDQENLGDLKDLTREAQILSSKQVDEKGNLVVSIIPVSEKESASPTMPEWMMDVRFNDEWDQLKYKGIQTNYQIGLRTDRPFDAQKEFIYYANQDLETLFFKVVRPPRLDETKPFPWTPDLKLLAQVVSGSTLALQQALAEDNLETARTLLQKQYKTILELRLNDGVQAGFLKVEDGKVVSVSKEVEKTEVPDWYTEVLEDSPGDKTKEVLPIESEKSISASNLLPFEELEEHIVRTERANDTSMSSLRFKNDYTPEEQIRLKDLITKENERIITYLKAKDLFGTYEEELENLDDVLRDLSISSDKSEVNETQGLITIKALDALRAKLLADGRDVDGNWERIGKLFNKDANSYIDFSEIKKLSEDDRITLNNCLLREGERLIAIAETRGMVFTADAVNSVKSQMKFSFSQTNADEWPVFWLIQEVDKLKTKLVDIKRIDRVTGEPLPVEAYDKVYRASVQQPNQLDQATSGETVTAHRQSFEPTVETPAQIAPEEDTRSEMDTVLDKVADGLRQNGESEIKMEGEGLKGLMGSLLQSGLLKDLNVQIENPEIDILTTSGVFRAFVKLNSGASFNIEVEMRNNTSGQLEISNIRTENIKGGVKDQLKIKGGAAAGKLLYKDPSNVLKDQINKQLESRNAQINTLSLGFVSDNGTKIKMSTKGTAEGFIR